jgi:hypothetical protein
MVTTDEIEARKLSLPANDPGPGPHPGHRLLARLIALAAQGGVSAGAIHEDQQVGRDLRQNDRSTG